MVGSGEYTSTMLEIEGELLADAVTRGKNNTYIQIATAAGLESLERINYWKELGEKQAKNLNAEPIFIPIFQKSDLDKNDYSDSIKNAGLIYFSGGNPHYLAQVYFGSNILSQILAAWKSGSSLAGCSAGAMAMSDQVSFSFRKNSEVTPGFGVLTSTSIYPHFDRYFNPLHLPLYKIIPNNKVTKWNIGIDENTALLHRKGNWSVSGKSFVHLLTSSDNSYQMKFDKKFESIAELNSLEIN